MDDSLGKFKYGYFFNRTNIEDFSNCLGTLRKRSDCAGYIRYIGETARLQPITLDREGLILECLADKPGDHHTVSTSLAWADGVEETHNDNREPILLGVRQTQELVHSFGCCVGPPAARCWSHQPVVILSEWYLDAFTINLGCRCQKDFALVAFCGREDCLSPHDICTDCVHRVINNKLHTNSSR